MEHAGRLGPAFFTYDLVSGVSRQVAQFDNVTDWDLFHDGSRIAVLSHEPGRGRVRIVRLSGEAEHEFTVEASGLTFIYCAANEKGVYLSARQPPGRNTLLYLDLRGRTTVLLDRGDFGQFIWPSPDGHYLSMTRTTMTSDTWLLEGF